MNFEQGLEAGSFITMGRLYYVTGSVGERVIVGTDPADYPEILDLGVDGKEVKLRVDKHCYGAEYQQIVPSHTCKAGVYTITIDATEPRFQLDIDPDDARKLRDAGFRDCEEVSLRIEKLPYSRQRQASYSGLNLDCTILVPIE